MIAKHLIPRIGAKPVCSLTPDGQKVVFESEVPYAELVQSVTQARVLVVNDEPVILELLTNILNADGHQVDIVANGNDALDMITSHVYNLILLDIHMPYTGGS